MNIARLTRCDVILPSALLVCCALEEELVQGFKREDGTQETLSPDDFMLCHLARGQLFEHTAGQLVDVCKPFTHASCKTRKKCQREHIALIRDLLECNTMTIIRPVESFKSWKSYVSEMYSYWTLCRHCRNSLKREWIQSQQYNWNELPKIFHVELTHWGTKFKIDSIDDDASTLVITRCRFTYTPIPQLTLPEQSGEVDDD